MKYSEFKQCVESLRSSETTSAMVYLVFKSATNFTLRLMDVESSSQSDIAGRYLIGLEKDVKELAEGSDSDFEFQKLSVADDRTCKVYEYDLELSEDLSFISKLHENGNCEKFSTDRDNLNELYGYAVVLGAEDEKVVLFRKHMPVNTFIPKRLCFFNDGTRFKRFTKPVIRLEDDCHVVFMRQKLIVRSLNVLERYLGFHNAIVKEAHKCAKLAALQNIVFGSEKFEQWIDADVSFARRLVCVQKSSPVLGRISVEQLVKFIQDKTHLSRKIRVVQTSEGPRIEIKSKSAGKLFLKVLNDDYLRSELTDLNYESVAKNQVRENE